MLKKLLRKIGLIKPKKLVNKNGRPAKNVNLDLIYHYKKVEKLSNREIARRMDISEWTVRERIKQINNLPHIYPEKI